MATHVAALRGRLGRVRRRWRTTAFFRGLLMVLTETLGLFLLFALADWIYRFSGAFRLGLLSMGGTILAVLFARHCLYPLLRRISDEQVALLLEERSAEAEGTVLSAVEFGRQRRSGLYNYIVSFLVDDAVRRIDSTNLRVISNLRRLRKHTLAALALLLFFAGTTLTFPGFLKERSQRIFNPMVSIRQEQKESQSKMEAEQALKMLLDAPLAFDVYPKEARLLRGRGLDISVRLSRKPVGAPVLLFRPTSGGDWQQLIMSEIEALNGYGIRLNDINEDMEYFVATSAKNKSDVYHISVYDPLALKGIELTYRYPAYLESDPVTQFGSNGDISVPAGTKVDLRLVANNPLRAARLIFDDKRVLDLQPGAKAEDGAKTAFVVDKDATYSFELADVYDMTLSSAQFYYVKAAPDDPPTVKMTAPKVDMSVHPWCEVTFRAEVSDDYGVKDANVMLTYYRGENATPVTLSMKPAGKPVKNLRDGVVECVWELEQVKPRPKIGDMIFYYMEVGDRKGQTARTDMFFITYQPVEVAAAWPAEIAPPDLPHWDFFHVPDLVLFIAAAWDIESSRGKVLAAEFNAKCDKLAGRMCGEGSNMGDENEGGRILEFFGRGSNVSKGITDARDPAAAAMIAKGEALLEKSVEELRPNHQPGKAAQLMTAAYAIAESLKTEKRKVDFELNPEPLHTGQPSGGYSDDPLMDQVMFRPPSVMSDSLTAFQQQDNPRHFLPPDYRRQVTVKDRQGMVMKQLKVVGEIYASEEQLIELAREQLGHIRLREAAAEGLPNDASQGGGAGPEEIRVDKRAIPYKPLDPHSGDVADAERPQNPQGKKEADKGLKYAKIKGNQRRGPGNPNQSQTPGGGASGEDQEQEKQEPLDPELAKNMEQSERPYRRPSPPTGGGGGGGQQQDQQQPPQGEQTPGGGGGSPQQQQQQGAMAGQLSAQQAGLAQQTENLARGVAQEMQAGDPLTQKAVDELRSAANQMQQAAENFRRGNVQAGVAQARDAQKNLRRVSNILTARQYDSLERAVAAAQDGAAALLNNQYRVAQATDQIARRVGELAPEAAGQSGQGAAQPQGQPGKTAPQGQPGQTPPQGTPGQQDQSGKPLPSGQQGQGGKPGPAGQPGQPGEQGQPGKSGKDSSQGKPGPSRQAVELASTRDPRLGGQLKTVANVQGQLADDVGRFVEYVKDLQTWAKESQKDRVANDLGDVTNEIKQQDTPQKMVDAAVDLSRNEVGAARATQEEIIKSLANTVGRLQETSDLLTGSSTGLLRRASRDARQVGSRVAELAGLPQPGGGQSGPQGQQSPSGRPGAQSPSGQPQGQAGPPGPKGGQPGTPGKTGPQGQPGPTTQPGKPGEGDQTAEAGTTTQPGQGLAGTTTQPGGPPNPKGENPLADLLAGQETSAEAGSGMPSKSGGTPSATGGGGMGLNQDIEDVFALSQRLVGTLRRERLTEEELLKYLEQRTGDIESFRKMFERSRKADAGKFVNVVTSIGQNLEAALKEALSAKRLEAEGREECPPQYRQYVNAYYEALSKAAGTRPEK